MSEYIGTLEFNLDGGVDLGGRSLVNLEEFLILFETEHTGEDVGREGLALGIEIADYAVIETARSLDLVFGVGQFILQFLEVLRCFQIGIVLGDREQALHGLLEIALGLGGLGRSLGTQGSSAGVRDVLEDALLVRGIALDVIDQIRDQVEPTLELHRDIAPGLVRLLIESDQAVEHASQEDDEQYDNHNDDN